MPRLIQQIEAQFKLHLSTSLLEACFALQVSSLDPGINLWHMLYDQKYIIMYAFDSAHASKDQQC